MKIAKSLLCVAAVSTGFLALTGPVTAAECVAPNCFILPSQGEEGQKKGYCEDFPVQVEVTSSQDLRGGGKFTGSGFATVTNTETGESITYNVSGPGSFTTTPKGGFAVDASGPNFFYTTAGNSYEGVPPLVYTTGHVAFTVDRSGKTTAFEVSGSLTDVCAVLGPGSAGT